MIRLPSLFFIILGAALTFLLFSLKYQVQDLEKEFGELNRAIVAERQSIQVLRAEWSVLNEPARLKTLAERFLGLKPVIPAQLGSFADLPERKATPDGGGNGAPSAGVSDLVAGSPMLAAAMTRPEQ